MEFFCKSLLVFQVTDIHNERLSHITGAQALLRSYGLSRTSYARIAQALIKHCSTTGIKFTHYPLSKFIFISLWTKFSDDFISF